MAGRPKKRRLRGPQPHAPHCFCRACIIAKRGGVRIVNGVAKPRSAFEALDMLGHDEDFEPTTDGEPCPHLPGTPERIEWMARRAVLGQQLFNSQDRNSINADSED